MIDDIRIDMNKFKVSKEDKKVFNGLNKFITDISNNKIKKEDAAWRLKKGMSDLIWLRQKQSSVFQNNIIQVVYQLFDSFGFNKEFQPLFSEKKIRSITTTKLCKSELW